MDFNALCLYVFNCSFFVLNTPPTQDSVTLFPFPVRIKINVQFINSFSHKMIVSMNCALKKSAVIFIGVGVLRIEFSQDYTS